jgi:predicted Fe-Mo cluster-binding NifX family protein
MRVAIPVCAEHTATTMDFARELLVADCEEVREVHRTLTAFEETQPTNRANRVIRLGIDVVICGAVSRPLATLIQDAGIRIIPLVSGSVDEVLAAFLTDRLDEARFLLAGCTRDDRQKLVRRAGAPAR